MKNLCIPDVVFGEVYKKGRLTVITQGWGYFDVSRLQLISLISWMPPGNSHY